MDKIGIYQRCCDVILQRAEEKCDSLYKKLQETGNFRDYYPDMMKSLVDAAINIRYKDSWIYGDAVLTDEERPIMEGIYDASAEKLKAMKEKEMQRSIEYKCKVLGGIA